MTKTNRIEHQQAYRELAYRYEGGGLRAIEDHPFSENWWNGPLTTPVIEAAGFGELASWGTQDGAGLTIRVRRPDSPGQDRWPDATYLLELSLGTHDEPWLIFVAGLGDALAFVRELAIVLQLAWVSEDRNRSRAKAPLAPNHDHDYCQARVALEEFLDQRAA
jgi:hypothetical protein